MHITLSVKVHLATLHHQPIGNKRKILVLFAHDRKKVVLYFKIQWVQLALQGVKPCSHITKFSPILKYRSVIQFSIVSMVMG